jgi:hypothetical protein
MKTLAKVTLPTAIVLAAGGACFTAISIWAPPEVREWLFGGNGLLWTVVAAFVLKRPGDLLAQLRQVVTEEKTPTDGATDKEPS